MVRIENLIVEGKCFMPFKLKSDFIFVIKKAITKLMAKKLFVPDEYMPFLERDNFLNINFVAANIMEEPTLFQKIKFNLNLISKHQMNKERYFRWLRLQRDELPHNVNFSIVPTVISEKQGFIIEIRSEPTMLLKICQLNVTPTFLKSPQGELIYSKIIDRNIQFIKEIIFSLGAKILEEPKAKVLHKFEPMKTPIIDEMEKLGIKNVSGILSKGRKKIERGDIEDGLTDLRASLEIISGYLVRKIKKKPSSSINENLNILAEDGFIDKKIIKLVSLVLKNWLHKAAHERQGISLNDARLVFSLVEDVHNYLLKKVIYRL